MFISFFSTCCLFSTVKLCFSETVKVPIEQFKDVAHLN